MLSKIDKVIITISIITCVVILLNPPMAIFNYETGHFIRSLSRDQMPDPEARIYSRLLYELFTVTVITVGIFVLKKLFSKRRSSV